MHAKVTQKINLCEMFKYENCRLSLKVIAVSNTSGFIPGTRVNECNINVLDFWK